MPKRSIRQIAIAVLALFIIAGVSLVDSNAQRRKRKRRSRPSAPRITNPAIYQPSPSDNANSNASDAVNNSESTNANTQSQDQQTIRSLSSQVDRLTEKISQMDEAQRSLVDLERLSRAEQRASSLRSELRDVQAKESDLQARAEEIDYALKPENIERSVAGYGTTHPEELREQRRRQLESEKQRLQKQLDQLAISHSRLDEAIATSDAEIDRLRKKLDAAEQADIENAKIKAQSGEDTMRPAPRPSPSPSPYPMP